MSLLDPIKNWAQNNINLILSFLRIFKPILIFKGTAFVTKFADVQEVLSRPNIFGVTYAEKMNRITDGSNFYLGMNDTAVYTRDVSNMRVVFPRTDITDRVKPLVENYAQSLVEAAKDGKLDVVKDLSEKVPSHFCAEYFGIPGPDVATFVDWTTYMFQYLFFPGNSKEVDEKALAYAAELRSHIDKLIENRKTSGEKKDDVLGRCLALQTSGTDGMTDIDIRNNILGNLIGAVPTTSKCVAQILNYLLDHNEILAQAQTAARSNEDEALRKIMLECLRLDPFAPGMTRITLEDYTIAKGTFRATKIKKDTPVLALTQSAMMDGGEISNPKSFRLDRPDYHYMPFGYGMHTCSGYYVNMVQIPMILKAILKKENLTREQGDAGKMECRGPFPSHLCVRFTPTNN